MFVQFQAGQFADIEGFHKQQQRDVNIIIHSWCDFI